MPHIQFLKQWKYELLLLTLIQHLYIGIFLTDLGFYTRTIWPINMVLLGIASVGVFIEKGIFKNLVQQFLFILVVLLPLGLAFFDKSRFYFLFLNASYVIFFLFIFWEIIRFLIRPGYINADIIFASACGYLLLIEIATFLFQFYFYQNAASFKGLDTSNAAATYIDLVYFSTITLTSIGFGDITPNLHYTKLLTAVFGVSGQFYTVVLVGILISKFVSNSNK